MTTLTRADVEIIERRTRPYADEATDWRVRILGLDYTVASWPDYLGNGPATLAVPIGPGHDVYPASAIVDVSIVHTRDHWACIDELLAWLSLDVDDGWSRPVVGVSHRVDLPPVDLVAVFSVRDEHTIKLWSIRDLASHFDAWREDDTRDEPDDFHREHPAMIYVRQGSRLMEAIYERVGHGDGNEVRVMVRPELRIVAAARY